MNVLASTPGVTKTAVDHVVRPESPDGHEWVNDAKEREHQMPLVGSAFEKDSQIVCRKLKAATVGTDAWTWIEAHDAQENGRAAWLALTGHHNGKGELNKRVEKAKEQLRRLHHENERSFSFERCATRMKEAHAVLDEDPNERKTEKQKVDGLMNVTQSQETALVSAKTWMHANHARDLDGAVACFSGIVSKVHAPAIAKHQQRSKRKISSVSGRQGERGGRGRGSGRGGRGHGRGGRGHGGRGGRGRGCGRGCGGSDPMTINGVDVSDVTRNFTQEEWTALGSARTFVVNQRNQSNRCGGGRQSGVDVSPEEAATLKGMSVTSELIVRQQQLGVKLRVMTQLDAELDSAEDAMDQTLAVEPMAVEVAVDS